MSFVEADYQLQSGLFRVLTNAGLAELFLMLNKTMRLIHAKQFRGRQSHVFRF